MLRAIYDIVIPTNARYYGHGEKCMAARENIHQKIGIVHKCIPYRLCEM